MKQSRDDNNGDDFAGYSSMRNRSSSRDNDNRKQQQTINNNCTEIQVNKSVDEVASQRRCFRCRDRVNWRTELVGLKHHYFDDFVYNKSAVNRTKGV